MLTNRAATVSSIIPGFSTLGLLCLCFALVTILGLVLDQPKGLAAEQKVQVSSLLTHRVPLMLQFGKSWCPRCKSTRPILDSSARAYEGRAMIVPVDVESNMELVRDFRIRLIPTQVFLTPDGREFFRHEGILQAHQIADVFVRMGLPRSETR